jgi:hypothetical protein
LINPSQKKTVVEICGFHGGEDGGYLGCDTLSASSWFQHFREACGLHPEDGGNMYLLNIGTHLQVDMAS